MLAHGDREEYKIGFTKDINARVDKVNLQVPERVWVIHKIYTNDPKWLEQIWHKRFANKRKNGEWFDLTPEDIIEFKKHQETNNPEIDCPPQLSLPISSQDNVARPFSQLPPQIRLTLPNPPSDRDAAIERVKAYFDLLKSKHPDKAAKLAISYKFQTEQLNSEVARFRANRASEKEALAKWEERARIAADKKVR